MRRVALGLCATVLLAGACSGDSEPASAPSSTAPSTAAAGAPSSTTTSSTMPRCPPGGPQPAGPVKDIGAGDFDGDHKDDTVVVDDRGDDHSSPVTIRLTTAQGVRSALTVEPLAAVEVLGIAEVEGRPYVWVRQGNNTAHRDLVTLVAFHQCALTQVKDKDGKAYAFEVHYEPSPQRWYGVGCVRGELVGLYGESDGGPVVRWTRTHVDIDGAAAANGRKESGTFTKGKDDAAIELLADAQCGEHVFWSEG